MTPEAVEQQQAVIVSNIQSEAKKVVEKSIEVNEPRAEISHKVELSYYPELDLGALYAARPQPMSIFQYESADNFYAQLDDLFKDFDSKFGLFQKVCDSNLRNGLILSREDVEIPKLAIAAKFYDDQSWYRAQISK